MRTGTAAFVAAVCAVVVGLGVAPGALGKAKPCRAGTVKVKVNGHARCVAKRLALPAPAKTAPGLAQLRGALTLTQVGLTTRSGRHTPSLARRVGPSWRTARSRLLRAMSATITRITKPLRRPAAAMGAADENCQAIDIFSQGGTFDTGGQTSAFGVSYSTNSASVSMGITASGGLQIGIKTTVDGNTYTMTYNSGVSECTKAALPACPEADGGLDSYGTQGKVGYSMTVTRGGNVLTKRTYAKTITVETKGKVADDAKLDYVDVRYGEKTVVDLDGVHYTSYGTRLTRIDMRSGTYAPGDSVSFGSATLGGDIANAAGIEADAGDFAAFVNKTIGEYRQRETAWQAPNACAKLTFDAKSGALTLSPGNHGTFTAEVDTNKDGQRATAAKWTLSGQQNGTFSPTSSGDPQPSIAYDVSDSPSGSTVSVSAKATSTAGVAQDTWSQNLRQLNTISGTFTGHATGLGVIYDWTGTATFQRIDAGAGSEGPGGIFQLTSGQATVTVSGSENGSNCQQTGTSTISIFGESPWTVTGSDAPFSYRMTASFLPTPPQATNVNCSDPNQNGTPAGLGSMPVPALQSGDDAGGANPDGLTRTTDDLYVYSNSASTSPNSDPTASWTWSFTGSP